MSILQFRYCPTCREKTYHRYENFLRSRFVKQNGWQCIHCRKAHLKTRWKADQSPSVSA